MERFSKIFIEDIKWGEIQVNRCIYKHDIIINKGLVTEWDWSKFKTNHKYGIKVEELKAFLVNGFFDVNKIILSTGMLSKLNIHDETYLFLTTINDVEFFIGDTISAYKTYNKWIKEKHKVLAFFHLTC